MAATIFWAHGDCIPRFLQTSLGALRSLFAETLAQAQRAGLQVAQVPAWYDVDEKDDLQKLIAELTPHENAPAPRGHEPCWLGWGCFRGLSSGRA